MKTWKEFCEENKDLMMECADGSKVVEITESGFNKIQRYGQHKGMVEAAEMLNPEDETNDCSACRRHLKDVQAAIVTAAEKYK